MTSDVLSRPAPRLSRTARRATLVLHVGCAVGWMGADVVLAVLVLAGRLSDDGAVVAAAYTSLGLVIPAVVPVLAVGMLATGVALGLGTQWGLVRHRWVLAKLVIGVVLTVLVFVALVPGAQGIPVQLSGTAAEVREAVGPEGRSLVFPPFVSFAALAVALVASIVKPGGRTRWGRVPSRRVEG